VAPGQGLPISKEKQKSKKSGHETLSWKIRVMKKKKGLAGSPQLCLPAASKTREETPGIETERDCKSKKSNLTIDHVLTKSANK